MEFVGKTADGRLIHYIDKKRYLWLLSLTGGFNPPIAIALYFATGHNPVTMLFPLFYNFAVIPLVDALMGEDRHNPPEEVVRHLAQDNYYRVLLYAGIVLLFASFLAVAWFLGTYRIPWWAYTVSALGTGFQSSGAILLGHELGHKNNRADRIAAQVANGLVGYGHFCIEHNVGHHVHVATPKTAPARGWAKASISSFAVKFPEHLGAAGTMSENDWPNRATGRSPGTIQFCCRGR